jgi:ribosomal-protein-alanine N-acetyltransferase
MQPADLEAVQEIERESFEAGWPATAFEREIASNAMARYLVLRLGDEGEVIGFGGLWLMVDEAHIVTVAVQPRYRRHGYGNLLVYGLIRTAMAGQMAAATLECRVSNEAARRLYSGWGFYEVGLRPRYYSDNGEDAVIMTTEELGSPAYRERMGRLEAALEARWPGCTAMTAGGA